VGAVQVKDDDQIMLITNGGTLVRTPVKDVSLVGRNTQGVRLINLSNDERLVGLERVIEEDDADESAEITEE
jgi:DNA gyrase subunit A